MKRIFPFLQRALLFALLVVTSCQKSPDVEKPGFNEPASNVYVYEEKDTQYLTEVVWGETLSFTPETPANLIPPVGEIVQMPVTDMTPYGFLGRVVSVETGDAIVVSTEMVPLDEAYPNLSIDKDFDFLEDFIGVFDEDGNPVEYTIVENDPETRGRDSDDSLSEFDLEKRNLYFPLPECIFGKDFKVVASAELSFKGSHIDVDNKDGLRYLNIELIPQLRLSAGLYAQFKKTKKEFNSKRLTIKGRIIAGPVVIPVTIPIWFRAGVEGSVEVEVDLNVTKGYRAYVSYKDEQWDYGCEKYKSDDQLPFVSTYFDVSGALHAGICAQFILGLYTRTAGVGIEGYTRAQLEASASLDNIDPFASNPEAMFSVAVEPRIFCEVKLFSKRMDLFTADLPELYIFRRSVTLFPAIEQFTATGEKETGEISYLSTSYCLFESMGCKTGAALYEPDAKTEKEVFYPAHDKMDRLGNRFYHQDISGLQPGSTYYAAPVISWGDFRWTGDKVKLQTEGNYHLAFRCSEQDYDVITFDFPLRESSGNLLDFSVEATDYDGSAMRCHIVGHYDSSTMTLFGTFDFYFYDNPNQQRVDKFSVSLADGDSGYVDCPKFVDNGGCTAALRVYSVTEGGGGGYSRVPSRLKGSSCTVGIRNPNYVVE